jgi:hypothetical protein
VFSFRLHAARRRQRSLRPVDELVAFVEQLLRGKLTCLQIIMIFQWYTSSQFYSEWRAMPPNVAANTICCAFLRFFARLSGWQSFVFSMIAVFGWLLGGVLVAALAAPF